MKITFKPQWKYNEKEGVLDLDIDFTINNEKYHDNHAMGAFSFDELKQMLTEIGFDIVLVDKKFDNPNENGAIFVCKK